MMLMGSADAWAKTNVAPARMPPAEVQPSTPRSASSTESAADPSFAGNYANREAQTPGLEKFQGGDYVVITSTGLVLILLVVILVLLL